MCESMRCLLDLGAVRDGHRPTLDSGMNWHVILLPFIIFSCLNMRPPTVR